MLKKNCYLEKGSFLPLPLPASWILTQESSQEDTGRLREKEEYLSLLSLLIQ